MNFEPLGDFTPIALLQTIPNTLFLHPQVPAKTLRELVQIARKAPGKIAYGSGGVGSANHIAVELLQSLARVKFTHVPYKTASAGFVGAMSGDVDMVVTVISSGVSHVKAGRMRAIVGMDHKRSHSLPDVPTSSESGMPELIAVDWYALMAPAGTPRPVLDRLQRSSSSGPSMRSGAGCSRLRASRPSRQARQESP